MRRVNQAEQRRRHVLIPGEINHNGVRLKYYIHSCFIWHQLPGGRETYFTCYPLPQDSIYLLECYLKFIINPDESANFNVAGKRCCPLGGHYCRDFDSAEQVCEHILRVHFKRKFKCRQRIGQRACREIVDNLMDLQTHLKSVHGMHSSEFREELETINDVFDLRV